jgi:hypothetical protein
LHMPAGWMPDTGWRLLFATGAAHRVPYLR